MITEKSIAQLLRLAKDAHHGHELAAAQAGTELPEPWEEWYAGYMVAKLPELAPRGLLAERLVLIAAADKGLEPAEDWPKRYAMWLVEIYSNLTF